jgi:hypothetical protein
MRQELIDAARQAGEDPDEVIAEAERLIDGGDGGTTAAADAPLFQYLLPFFTVDEIRATRGLGAVEDGAMLAGQWIERHGGILRPAQPGAPSAADEGAASLAAAKIAAILASELGMPLDEAQIRERFGFAAPSQGKRAR